MPSFVTREKSIAHNILRTVLKHGDQETFIAFVGREHLIGVTRQMIEYMNKGEEFLQYQRPPQVIEEPKLTTDKNYRRELIKRHALGSSIYDEGDSDYSSIPFRHNEDDNQFQKVYEIKNLQKVSLADIFGDIEGLGIDFAKEDFVDPSKSKKDAQEII